jgi:hypothetical protein
VKCPVGLVIWIGDADPVLLFALFFSSLAGAVEDVENAGGFLPAFSKSCGKARLHRGFP